MNRFTEDRHVALTVNIRKTQEKKIIEVPFRVVPNTERLRVSMRVLPSGEPATIDLGLRGPAGIRGWSGGARTDVVIAPETATPGYVPGDIEAGQWAVLLGLYEIPARGAVVELAMDMTDAAPRWIPGDLHSHTVHSDGAFTIDEAATAAEHAGIEFLALTDHNTISQNLSYPRDRPVLFIPGMEFTTYTGHANLVGAARPVDDFRVASQADLSACLKLASERGALISVNHPFDAACPSCSWRWSWDDSVDAVEVWNGPWRPANARALTWWQSVLVSGRKLVAVGGSDTHNRSQAAVKHGWPTTWVYASGLRANAIVEAVRRGHVFLSYAPFGPRLDLYCGRQKMGDVVPQGSPETVTLRVDRLQPGDDIRLISDLGTVEHKRVSNAERSVELNREHRGLRFVRVEVWRTFPEVSQPLMAAISNPLYFGPEWI